MFKGKLHFHVNVDMKSCAIFKQRNIYKPQELPPLNICAIFSFVALNSTPNLTRRTFLFFYYCKNIHIGYEWQLKNMSVKYEFLDELTFSIEF